MYKHNTVKDWLDLFLKYTNQYTSNLYPIW